MFVGVCGCLRVFAGVCGCLWQGSTPGTQGGAFGETSRSDVPERRPGATSRWSVLGWFVASWACLWGVWLFLARRRLRHLRRHLRLPPCTPAPYSCLGASWAAPSHPKPSYQEVGLSDKAALNELRRACATIWCRFGKDWLQIRQGLATDALPCH